MKRICSICARGGSKGVPGKNIKPINGVPLIAHSIKHAMESGIFDAIAVSSDSEEILKVAKEYGVQYLIKRPDSLASDTSGKLPAIEHCLIETEKLVGYQFETVVDIDSTSPLRTVEDIKNVVNLLENSGCDNVITACPARRSPYFNLVELDSSENVVLSKVLPKNIVRRQDSPRCFDMNASIYAWKRVSLIGSKSVFFENTKLYEMPEERSIDIDNPIDFKIVEMIMGEENE